jgi:hypothetical protein
LILNESIEQSVALTQLPHALPRPPLQLVASATTTAAAAAAAAAVQPRAAAAAAAKGPTPAGSRYSMRLKTQGVRFCSASAQTPLELPKRETSSGDPVYFCLAWDETGQQLYAGGRDTLLTVWNPDSGRAVHTCVRA